jgi:hypothetical protein
MGKGVDAVVFLRRETVKCMFDLTGYVGDRTGRGENRLHSPSDTMDGEEKYEH